MTEYSYIVKVISSVNCDNQDYGTGIVVSKNIVITSQHVVENRYQIRICYHNLDFLGKVCRLAGDYALIEISDENFPLLYLKEQFQYKFTNQEIFSSDSEWKIVGFIQDSRELIIVTGKGLKKLPNKIEDYDCLALGISASIQCDYVGLSGAPIICNERIIGVAQYQCYGQSSSPSAIGFLSTDRFLRDIPQYLISDSLYISDLFARANRLCKKEISSNINSRKYIPDIFVEEPYCKDYLRYFADPILFVKKIIFDIKNFDFTLINSNLDDKKVRFALDDIIVSPDELSSVCERLCNVIKANIDILTVKKQSSNNEKYNFNIERKKRALQFNSLKIDLEEIQERLDFASKKVILLTGKAGSGKTNFLCDFVENFLLKKNIPTLYFNASNFTEKPSNEITEFIKGELDLDLNYVKESLKVLWREHKKILVIVIDGLNENSSIKNFELNIIKSIEFLKGLPHVKLIMTTRKELLCERFPNLEKNPFSDEFKIIEIPKHYDDMLKDRIIKGYLKYFNIKIIDYLDEKVLSYLTENILLFRYFCEVYQGKSRVSLYDMFNYSLFSKYYNKIKETKKIEVPLGDCLFDDLINKISELMIKKETFAKLPVNCLSLSESKYSLLNDLLSSGVIFSEEIKDGITKDPVRSISFTFDEFRDFCLTKYMLTKNNEIKNFYTIWERMHKYNWVIREGVEKYAFYIAKTQDEAHELLPLFTDNEYFQSIYWDNIWNFDDESIDESDIMKWKHGFLEATHYMYIITSNLLRRRDRNYYKNSSIELLFSFLNELSLTPGKYDLIIRKLFPDNSISNFEKVNANRVLYRNQLLPLMEQKCNKDLLSRDFLRLAIYLYHLMPSEITNFWNKIVNLETSLAVNILKEYSGFDMKYVFLRQNANEIVNSLNNANSDLSDLFINHNDNNFSYPDVISSIHKIWEI